MNFLIMEIKGEKYFRRTKLREKLAVIDSSACAVLTSEELKKFRIINSSHINKHLSVANNSY